MNRNQKKTRIIKAAKAVRRTAKGKGSYLSDLVKKHRSKIPRFIGAGLGALVGNPQRGYDMGAAVSRDLLGWGRYRRPLRGRGAYGEPWSVSNNSLTSDGNIPAVSNLKDAGLRISHTEPIGVVLSSSGFSNSVYFVNAGLSNIFPWLSRIASNFQQWKLNGMLITFRSELTDAVASFSSLGSVAIAANLNPAERPCATQVELEQLKFCAVAKPSRNIVAPIECDRRSTPVASYYVRTQAVPQNASIMDYDHCTIQVATFGQPSAGVVLGRLYVSYDVSLLNPRMSSIPTSGISVFRFAGPTTANYFGTELNAVVDELGLKFKIPNNFITFPAGTYGVFNLQYVVRGAATTPTAPLTVTMSPADMTSSVKIYPIGPTVGPELSSTVNNYQSSTGLIYCIMATTFEITDVSQAHEFAITSGLIPASAYGTLIVSRLPFSPGSSSSLSSVENYFSRVQEESKEEDDQSIVSVSTALSSMNVSVPAAAGSFFRRPH